MERIPDMHMGLELKFGDHLKHEQKTFCLEMLYARQGVLMGRSTSLLRNWLQPRIQVDFLEPCHLLYEQTPKKKGSVTP